MKKINNLFQFLLLVLLISCQTDWKTDYERIIEKSEKDFSLIKQIDTIENPDTKTQINIYQANEISKVEVNFKVEDFIEITDEFYKNDSLIFMEKVYGTSPLIYKRKRKKEEPIGELIERITYFKNRKNGIEKLRSVNYHLGDDLTILNNKLKNLDFEIKNIGEKEYVHIKEMYERYKNY